MIRFLLYSLAFFLALQVLPASEKPYLTYKEQGGLSPYKEIVVIIEKSGQTHVQIEKRSPRFNYETRLENEELETLRTLVRATDFFSQPDKDPSFATDVGETEITVNDAERARTLRFGYRPSLHPLTEFILKIAWQAEAWEALRTGNAYDVVGALVPSDSRGKALQPHLFKEPLMAFLRSTRESRKTNYALEALAAVTTPEEFAGFVASQSRPDPRTGPVLGPYGNYPKSHRLALCPLCLAYLKENYPQPNDYARGDNVTRFLSDILGEFRYEPAIPYFLQLFDAQNEVALSIPLICLARIGRPCLYELVTRLDSKNEAHRLNAMKVMTLAFRSNSKNPVTNPVSDYEFDEMRKVFRGMVLPKLTQLSEKDSVEAVREEAARTIGQITSELTKKDEITGPFVKLSVMPDHRLKRTKLEGEEHMSICWHVIRDGNPVVQSFSQGETEYTPPDHTPAVYTAYVSAWVQGEYRVVSNIVSYKIASSLPSPQ